MFLAELENDYFYINLSDKDGLHIEHFINKLTNDDILKSSTNAGLFLINRVIPNKYFELFICQKTQAGMPVSPKGVKYLFGIT